MMYFGNTGMHYRSRDEPKRNVKMRFLQEVEPESFQNNSEEVCLYCVLNFKVRKVN